jgi:hypothetical protein
LGVYFKDGPSPKMVLDVMIDAYVFSSYHKPPNNDHSRQLFLFGGLNLGMFFSKDVTQFDE